MNHPPVHLTPVDKIPTGFAALREALNPFRSPDPLYHWELPIAILLKDPLHPVPWTTRDTVKLKNDGERVDKEIRTMNERAEITFDLGKYKELHSDSSDEWPLLIDD